MDIRIVEHDTYLIVYLKGRLGFKDYPKFNEFIDRMAMDKDVVFDLEHLEHLDSSGIGMFFLGQKVIKDAGHDMSLKNPKGQVQRIFDITNIGDQIHIISED